MQVKINSQQQRMVSLLPKICCYRESCDLAFKNFKYFQNPCFLAYWEKTFSVILIPHFCTVHTEIIQGKCYLTHPIYILYKMATNAVALHSSQKETRFSLFNFLLCVQILLLHRGLCFVTLYICVWFMYPESEIFWD